MKKTIRNLFVTIALGLSILVYGTDTKKSNNEKNLIRNPQFEELDSKGMASKWFRYNNLGLKATDDCFLKIDTETFNALPIGGGFNAAKIVKKGDINSMLAQSDIAVEGGASYMLSIEHKETPGYSANIYICIDQLNANRKNITGKSYYFATNVKPSLEWKQFSKKLTVKSDAAFLELHICPNGKGTCWIKNVKLIKINNDDK